MRCLPIKDVFMGDDSNYALVGVLKKAIDHRDANVYIVYCTDQRGKDLFAHQRPHLGMLMLPKDVYAVIHPDNVYNVMENLIARPRTDGSPAPFIKLFIDLPTRVVFKQGTTGVDVTFIDRHVHDAAHLAHSLHVTTTIPEFYSVGAP